MRIPNRSEVTREFSEAEAFAHASELYRDWVTRNTPPPSAAIVAEKESQVFQPAVELQLAGLSIFGAKDMKEPDHLVLSFACFSVDHLLWGWFASVNFHPRIAFSLCRAALEASIFEIAAATDYSRFKSMWNSKREGTGGAVVKTLKNISNDLSWYLKSAWNIMAKLGHASKGPVLSPLATFCEGTELKRGLTFAGQFAGPLDARQLLYCASVLCSAAIAGVEAMNIGLRPLFTTSNEWCRKFEQFKKRLDTVVPIPDYLAQHLEGFRERFGPRHQNNKSA